MRIRPTRLTLAVVAATAAAASGTASASQSSTQRSQSTAGATRATIARGATVRLARTSAGRLLVNSRGFTLYMFTSDGRNRDHCVKVAGCTGVWPPLLSGRPSAGAGVNRRLLGTISIGHGRRQVTYAGHPLYTYSGDSGPGQTSYLGVSNFGGTWYGVSSSGRAVH